jgi:hypothetical protein
LLVALECQIEDYQMHVSESDCVFLIFFNLLKVASQTYIYTNDILAQGQGLMAVTVFYDKYSDLWSLSPSLLMTREIKILNNKATL